MSVLSKWTGLFRSKPKADLGLIDCVALELVRAKLEQMYGRVSLLNLRLWTSDQVMFGGAITSSRTIKIKARPVNPDELSVDGGFGLDVLPHLESTVIFVRRCEEAELEFYGLSITLTRWGSRNNTQQLLARQEPYLYALSDRLLRHNTREDKAA